jgi:hypothetical protein
LGWSVSVSNVVAATLTTCTSLAIMQESGSDELSLFNPKGIYPFLFGDYFTYLMVIISPKLTLSFVKLIALILGTKTSVDILFSLIELSLFNPKGIYPFLFGD